MKVGRNQLCPCGSGKKNKHCCMNTNTQQGCFYANIYYPGYIRLLEGSYYYVTIEGKVASVLVKRHLRPLEILDFDNELVERNNVKDEKAELKYPIQTISKEHIFMRFGEGFTKAVDNEKYDYRMFSPRFYSDLLICYEVEDIQSLSTFEGSFFKEVLESFINVYRKVAQDVHVKRYSDLYDDTLLVRVGVVSYAEGEANTSLEKRLTKNRDVKLAVSEMKFAMDGYSVPKFDQETEENNSIAMLKNLLLTSTIASADEILLKAFEELLVNKNYKYALLDAFIAAETSVMEFVNNRKISKGVSKQKLEKFKNDIGISYVLNIDLPMLIDNIRDDDRQIIGDVDKVRKQRNDVVHNGERVSQDEALFAINAVSKLINLLIAKS